MNDKLNSTLAVDENGQTAFDRVGAVLEALTGGPVQFVMCGEYTRGPDGSLVAVDTSTRDQSYSPDEIESASAEDEEYEAAIRAGVTAKVNAAIKALRDAQLHVLEAWEKADWKDHSNNAYLADNEISDLEHHACMLEYVKDGLAGEVRLNKELGIADDK